LMPPHTRRSWSGVAFQSWGNGNGSWQLPRAAGLMLGPPA